MILENRGQGPVKKAKLNYWVDVSIGVSFVLSAVSGLIFLLPVGSGAGLNSGFLGIRYSLWDQLHTWSSLAMMAGVLAHLVLHWNWIVGMTRKMLPTRESPRAAAAPAPGYKLTRRRFLSLGLTTVAAGVLVAGCAMLAGRQAAEPEQEDSATGGSQDDAELLLQQDDGSGSPDGPALFSQQEGNAPVTSEAEQPVQQLSGVACPRGMVNDPYPGRCRNYTDRDGDGICDFSVPGSGTN
jgi:Domain of unknown function (DUF4405)